MTSYIFDAAGNMVPGGDRALHTLFESAVPQVVLCDSRVNRRGFVRVDEHGDGARVFMRSDIAKRPALTALLYRLQDSAAKSIILYDHGYAPIIQSREKLIGWVETLLSAGVSRKSLFLSRRISCEDSSIALRIRAFLELAALADCLEEIAPICNQIFEQRYTITNLESDGDSVIIRSAGLGYKSFDPKWINMALGCRLQDGPDYHYGQWVAEAHRTALLTSRPLFDEVDAFISRPLRTPLRVTYSRCVQPFRLRKGPCYVLSASESRDDIDLRG
jgi:hypothetical protein